MEDPNWALIKQSSTIDMISGLLHSNLPKVALSAIGGLIVPYLDRTISPLAKD